MTALRFRDVFAEEDRDSGCAYESAIRDRGSRSAADPILAWMNDFGVSYSQRLRLAVFPDPEVHVGMNMVATSGATVSGPQASPSRSSPSVSAMTSGGLPLVSACSNFAAAWPRRHAA